MCSFQIDPQLEAIFAIKAELRMLKESLELNGPDKEYLREEINKLNAAIESLESAPQSKQLFDESRKTFYRGARAAVKLHKSKLRLASNLNLILEHSTAPSKNPRLFSEAELRRIRILQQKPTTNTLPFSESASGFDGACGLNLFGTLSLRERVRELSAGLVLTPQMTQILTAATPAILRGVPLLLIGETGGAKTALAEYLAESIHAGGYEFISGYSDITSAQVIGTHELRVADGATYSEFVPGPLLRAMRGGKPLIIDEINAMPADFLKRLNRILQLKSGEQFTVQENAGKSETVKRGFVIIATANEQSPDRYRGLHTLSSELLNRFGANTFRVNYPDSNVPFKELPRENLLLAVTALSDSKGKIFPYVSNDEIFRIARLAFLSQQIFAGNYSSGFDKLIDTDDRVDGTPGLHDTVLAPRTMVTILQNVVLNGGLLSVNDAVARFIAGIMHPKDRDTMKKIAEYVGLTLP